MSEFDFMSNEGNEGETQESGSQEFSFGETDSIPQPNYKIVHKTSKPVKKTGNRVIGMNMKKGEKGKKSKFAKKGTEVEKPKHTAKLTPGVVPPLQKIEQPPPEEEGFSFIDEGPAPISSNNADDDVSAFDFGAADGDEAVDDGTSAFDFGAAEPEDAQEASEFDFGSAEQSAPIPQQRVVNAPVQVPVAAAAAPPPQAPPQDDLPPEIKELGEEYGGFALSINNIALAVKDMYAETDKCKEDLAASEAQQAEASMKEEYDKAEQLALKMQELKDKIHENEQNFSYAIQEAFEKANEVPDFLKKHADVSEQQIPTLTTKQEQLENTLTSEKEQQEKDKASIEEERAKNKEAIDNLQAPIDLHTKTIEDMQAKYDQNVGDAAKPFDEKIAELETEKKEVNATINDLLKQIEQLRTKDKELQASIAKQQKERKAAVDAFQADLKAINSEKRQLDSEKRKVQADIRKIEAPFQSLLDIVEKRENKLQNLEKDLETTKQSLADAKSDVEQTEKANEIISQLCTNHLEYQDKRAEVATNLENHRQLVTDSNARLELLASQLITYRANLSSSEEFLMGSKAKEDELQARKTSAVSSKNFKAAKGFADQLKELKEHTEKAEKTIEDSKKGIESNENETTDLKSKIVEAQSSIEDESAQLTSLDYEFYQEGIETLNKLFEISHFSQKLLGGVKEMLETMLSHTEQPRPPTIEELQKQIDDLNAKIEEAVSNDDYETAEILQNKVVALTEKMKQLE